MCITFPEFAHFRILTRGEAWCPVIRPSLSYFLLAPLPYHMYHHWYLNNVIEISAVYVMWLLGCHLCISLRYIHVEYNPRNAHSMRVSIALLVCYISSFWVIVLCIYPYPSDLFHWRRSNRITSISSKGLPSILFEKQINKNKDGPKPLQMCDHFNDMLIPHAYVL